MGLVEKKGRNLQKLYKTELFFANKIKKGKERKGKEKREKRKRK